jgi:hypothetical protein
LIRVAGRPSSILGWLMVVLHSLVAAESFVAGGSVVLPGMALILVDGSTDPPEISSTTILPELFGRTYHPERSAALTRPILLLDVPVYLALRETICAIWPADTFSGLSRRSWVLGVAVVSFLSLQWYLAGAFLQRRLRPAGESRAV